MARPSKFSAERAAKIIEGLKIGMTRSAACGLVDVSHDSLARWIKRYARFAKEVEHAEDKAEARYIRVIARSAFGHQVQKTVTVQGVDSKTGKPFTETRTEEYEEYDWAAARFWLTHRKRKDWGDRLTIDLDREMERLYEEWKEALSATESAPTIH